MPPTPSRPTLPSWLTAHPSDMPKLSDRDAACIVLPDLDYDAQLIAVHHLLRTNAQANQALDADIRDLEEIARSSTGWRNEQAVNEWVDRMHDSVYLDAAHSMAAIGMLSPFLESLFVQAFHGIRSAFFWQLTPPVTHIRWHADHRLSWDCHFALIGSKWTKGLAAGILDLADATGLRPHLPATLSPLLHALFAYRNKMFHDGFEWSAKVRREFDTRCATEGWPTNWFTRSERGGETWIVYMSDTLVNECLDLTEQVITGIGAFCNSQLA